jgi:hypothetical protein
MVVPFEPEAPDKTIDSAIAALLQQGTLERGHTIVIISSISAGDSMVDAVQMRTI